TGRALSSLLPDRDGEFRRIFAEVASPRPQVIAWVLFLAALLVAVSVPAILGTGPSPFVFNGGPGTALEFIASVHDIVSLAAPTPAEVLGVGGFLSGLVLLGLVLFFLPLRGLHRRMVDQKQRETARLRPNLGPIYEEGAGPHSAQDVAHLYRVDMMDRKVAAMAVWPYDVGILGRLSAITLSVIAILLSRIIAFIFHI